MITNMLKRLLVMTLVFALTFSSVSFSFVAANDIGVEPIKTVITGFDGFDGSKPLDTITVSDEETIQTSLPKFLMAVLDTDAIVSIPVSWEEKTDETDEVKTYEIILPPEYILSDDYQKQITEGTIRLPYVEVIIETTPEEGVQTEISEVPTHVQPEDQSEDDSALPDEEKKSIIITKFKEYEINGFNAFMNINIKPEDRETVESTFPDKIAIITDAGEIEMPAIWKCDNDIKKTNWDTYVFELELPEGYILSEELQMRCDVDGRLPYLQVNVITDAVYAITDSEYPFSEIVDCWKELSDAEVNEYFRNNNENEIFRFVTSLSSEDQQLLFEKNTILNQTVKVNDDEGTHELPYSQYILNGLSVKKDLSMFGRTYYGTGGNTGTAAVSGYTLYTFKDVYNSYTHTYRVNFKIPKNSLNTSSTVNYTLNVVTDSTSGQLPTGSELDSVDFNKVETYLKRGSTKSEASGGSTTGTNAAGDKIWITKEYIIAVIKFTVAKPRYTYPDVDIQVTSGSRLNLETYRWDAKGEDTVNYGVYHAKHSETYTSCVNMASAGINTFSTEAKNNDKVTIAFHRPTLKVNYYVNGGTVSKTDTNTAATSPYLSNSQTYNETWSSSGLLEPGTLGFSKTAEEPKSGAQWKNDSQTWNSEDASVKCTDLLDFTDGDVFTSKTKALYVNWVPSTYKITYDEAGGSAVSDLSYNKNTNITLATTSRSGYRFDGWKLSSGSGNWSAGTYSGGKNIGTGKYGNIKLVAQWTQVNPTYTLTLDKEGAATSNNGDAYLYECYGVKYYTNTSTQASVSSVSVPSRVGFQFGGYWLERYGEDTAGNVKVIDENGSILVGNTYFTSNRTLYARWRPATFNIGLDKNGGSGGHDVFFEQYNVKFFVDTTTWNEVTKISVPTRTNATFLGYYTKPQSEGKQSGTQIIDASGNIKVSNTYFYYHTSVYAHWDINSFYVEYTGNGNTSGSPPATVEVMRNTNYTLPNQNTLARAFTVTYNGNGGSPGATSHTANATFLGWLDENTYSYGSVSYPWYAFNAPYYANKYADLKSAFGYNKEDLINHWVRTTVKGSESRQSSSVFSAKYYYSNAAQDLINAFGSDIPSYVSHWITNGYNEWSGGNSGRKGVASVDNATANYYTASSTVSNLGIKGQKVTLKAKWKDASVTLPTPVRPGYTFNGWYTAASGGTKIGNAGASYTPSKNITLYAQWSAAAKPTVTYNANGGSVSPTSQTMTYGTVLSGMPTPTRTGYTHTRWFAKFTGSNYLNLGREYMYENKLAVHLDAYMSDWSVYKNNGQRLISCTEGGGFNIETSGEYIAFAAYDKGVGYKNAVSTSKTWASLGSGWHTFDIVFDGSKLYGYVDGTLVATSAAYSSGKIGYNSSNAIFVGAEAAGNATTPAGSYFNGYIANLVIKNTGTRITGANHQFMTPIHDMTLYADWASNNYKLIFNPNGGALKNPGKNLHNGTNTNYVPVTYNSANYYEMANDIPIRDGYDFAGWYDAAEGGTQVYYGSTDQAAGTGNAGYVTNKKYWSGNKWVHTANLTVYAHWVPKNYTTTIEHWTWGWKYQEGNNGEKKTAYQIGRTTKKADCDASISFTKADAVTIPNGFYLDPKVGTSAFEGSWKTYDMPYYTTQLPKNYSVEYDYKPYEYNIKYDLDGGINADSNPATYNVLYGATLSDPAKVGHTFKGWYLNGNKVTGVNQSRLEFTSADELYEALAVRTTGDLTFEAKWEVNKYDLTINPNGGYRASDNNTEIITITKDYNSTENVTEYKKRGYTLTGFTMTNTVSGSTTDLGGAKFVFSEDTRTGVYTQGTVPITLTAQWSPTVYSIDYDYAGGELPSGKTNPATYTIETDTFTLNNPEKRGYDFIGWTGTDLSSPTMTVTIPNGSIGNREYTANYTPKQFTISYEANGGEGSMSPHTIDYGTTIKIKDNEFSKEGYSFAGWTTIQPTTYEGEDDGYGWSKGSVPNVTGWTGTWSYLNGQYGIADNKLVLYARWIPNPYQIIYDANGGEGSMDSSDHIYDEEKQLSPNEFTKKFYTFVNWNTAPDGSGDSYTDKEIVKNLASGYNDTVTLYAQWAKRDYIISYMPNGGTGTMTSHTTRYEETVKIKDNTFTPPKGYQFAGWTTIIPDDLHGENDGYGWSTGSVPNVKGWSGTWKYDNGSYGIKDDKLVLYARWTPVDYAITYDYAGGELPSGKTNPATYNIETETFTLNEPVRHGYDFAGWTGTGLSSTTKPVTVKEGTTGELKFTAQWTPVTYSITYNYNGGELPSGKTNPATYTIETENFTLNNPVRRGYSFAGWTGTDLEKATDPVTVKKGSTGDRTYSATWTANTYTIALDKQDGTGGNDAFYEIYADRFYVDTSTKQSVDSVNAPTKRGHTFDGYFTEPNGSGQRITDENGTIIVSTIYFAENTTVYANWIPNHYTITLDKQSGTSGTDVLYEEFGIKYYIDKETLTETKNIDIPQRKGWIFKGYYTKPDNQGDEIVDEDGKIVAATTYFASDATIYAAWTPAEYTVSFNGNGATGGSMDDQKIHMDVATQLDTNGYKREFTVSYDPNGGNCSVTNATAKADFVGWLDENTFTYEGVSYPWYTFNAPYYANKYSSVKAQYGYNKKALIEHWVKNTVNGIESYNSSSYFNVKEYMEIGGADLTSVYGQQASAYVKHWSSEGYQSGRSGIKTKDLTTSNVYENKATVTNLSDEGDKTIELKAKWKDGNVTLPTPTRTGYIFLGWYDAAEGGKKIGDGGEAYTPSENTKVYAHWKLIYGYVQVKKSSADPDFVAGNDNYKLKDAEYTVYNSDGENVGVLTTAADGMSNTLYLPYGEYKVVETKAPTGYKLDATEHTAFVKEDGTIVTVDSEEEPYKGVRLSYGIYHTEQWDANRDHFNDIVDDPGDRDDKQFWAGEKFIIGGEFFYEDDGYINPHCLISKVEITNASAVGGEKYEYSFEEYIENEEYLNYITETAEGFILKQEGCLWHEDMVNRWGRGTHDLTFKFTYVDGSTSETTVTVNSTEYYFKLHRAM